MTLSLTTSQLATLAGPVEGPACRGIKSPELFFPNRWQVTPVTAPPSTAERKALQVCAGCPVRKRCLAQDLAECTTSSQVQGVRGGMRQSERRALYVELNGRRPRNGAQR